MNADAGASFPRDRDAYVRNSGVTGTKLLQYLGLQREPGPRRTTADRVWAMVMVIVVVATLLLTRSLDYWQQFAVLVAVAIVFGIVGGVTITTIAGRRERRNPGE